jgi:alcohol dehydrogenase class IV
MMPYGLEFNKDVCADKYKYLEKIIGTQDLIQWVRQLNTKLAIPASLKDMKLDAGRLAELSDLAVADACHQCNPKPVTRADFEALFRRAFQV